MALSLSYSLQQPQAELGPAVAAAAAASAAAAALTMNQGSLAGLSGPFGFGLQSSTGSGAASPVAGVVSSPGVVAAQPPGLAPVATSFAPESAPLLPPHPMGPLRPPEQGQLDFDVMAWLEDCTPRAIPRTPPAEKRKK